MLTSDNNIKDLLLQIEREATTNSFYEFLISFWDIIIAEPFQDAPHIKYICDELQYLVSFIKERKKKPYDLIFNVPPGSTKTTIVLQMFPAYMWAVDSTIRVLSSSHSATLSEQSSVKSKDIILSEKYKLLFPHVELRIDSKAKSRYTTTNGGNRHTTATTGNATGDHAHIKLMDDLQDISKAASKADRTAAINHMKMLFTREVEKGNSINVLIMQRLHELDCTAYLKGLSERRKVKHVCLPAEISDLVNPPEARKLYQNGLLDPIRMSHEILEEKKIELGTYGYTSQFEQEPTPPEGGLIKRNWFQLMPQNQFLRGDSVFDFFIDTAYEEKKKVSTTTGEAKNDPTGLLCTVRQGGKCYLWDYREVYMKIGDLCKFIDKWAISNHYSNKSRLMIEPKASGKSTVQVLVDNTNLNVMEITGGKDSKETELSNSAPTIQSGRFILIEGEWNRLFLDRVCGFPNAAHDEAVDLLCYAKKYYFDGNPEQQEKAIKKVASQLSL